ncbi:MAG: hypothetical protein QOF31_3319 [Mycobacterium sp.]|nr:hypothetical protein [Mycobacterium sp.]
MTVRYDAPNVAARAGNELIRWLAEAPESASQEHAPCGSAAARAASAGES